MICDIYCNFIRSTHHWTVPGHGVSHNPEVPGGDIAIFFDHEVLDKGRWPTYRAKFVFLLEPQTKYPNNYACVRENAQEFQRIFTCNRNLAAELPNAEFVAFGTGWCFGSSPLEKTELIGMIISNKPRLDSHLEGYRLRYAAAQEMLRRDLPVRGTGVGPRVSRREVIGPAKFAVEAENCIEPCYFTEKLIDCLLMKAVPIYFGPPCVSEFFDTQGMLLWRNMEQFQAHLDAVTTGTVRYEDFEDLLEENRERAIPLASSTSRWLPLVARELSCLSL